MNNTDQTDIENDRSLHQALIEYATTSCRLLFIQDASVFADFQAGTETSRDFSTLELCALFLDTILPEIHSYQLTEPMKARLKLLDLHPLFEKNPQGGYKHVPKFLDARFVMQPKSDFILSGELPRSSQGKRPAGSSVSHTMLLDSRTVTYGYPKFELSIDIAAMLSAMLSNDSELSSAQLHNLPEIKKRLRRAKESFEDTANILPYRNNLELLNDYIEVFYKLKTKLVRTLSNI